MDSGWALLLFLGAIRAGGTSLLAPLSYEEALASAVQLYNEAEDNPFAFQLLTAEARPDWKPPAETPQSFKFSIKETVCRSFENLDVGQCEFKENGVVKDCSGSYTFQRKPLAIRTKVLCNDI
uniref:Vipericidin n=1 Tax=Pogona vitticeps TaxID=103695 RepID=A0A6J0U5I8_9SAUR